MRRSRPQTTKPVPQDEQPITSFVRFSSPSWSTTRRRQFGQMKYGTRPKLPVARTGERFFRLAARGREVALGVECRHAPGAGGGHRLAVDVILNVARGEHARYVRLARLALRLDIAGLVH